jgi:CrcB protein
MQKYLLTGIGGFFGAIARLWVDTYISARFGDRFPYGTFVINMTGCFVIGVMLTVLNQRLNINPAWRYLLPIGFIGAYTTFSSFEFEAFSGYRGGGWPVPLLYITASVVVGFACVWAGSALGRLMA